VTASRRGWLWCVVFALLAAQMLGLVHRVVHGPKAVGGHVVQVAHDVKLDSLFSSHGDASDCRLYDQLGNGPAMPSLPALLPPVVPPSVLLQFFEGEVLARWAALFEARGPPSVR
jgi:hypothetical protein